MANTKNFTTEARAQLADEAAREVASIAELLKQQSALPASGGRPTWMRDCLLRHDSGVSTMPSPPSTRAPARNGCRRPTIATSARWPCWRRSTRILACCAA